MATCPRSQRGLTVNQLRNATVVQIYQLPLSSSVNVSRAFEDVLWQVAFFNGSARLSVKVSLYSRIAQRKSVRLLTGWFVVRIHVRELKAHAAMQSTVNRKLRLVWVTKIGFMPCIRYRRETYLYRPFFWMNNDVLVGNSFFFIYVLSVRLMRFPHRWFFSVLSSKKVRKFGRLVEWLKTFPTFNQEMRNTQSTRDFFAGSNPALSAAEEKRLAYKTS